MRRGRRSASSDPGGVQTQRRGGGGEALGTKIIKPIKLKHLAILTLIGYVHQTDQKNQILTILLIALIRIADRFMMKRVNWLVGGYYDDRRVCASMKHARCSTDDNHETKFQTGARKARGRKEHFIVL